MPIILPAKSVLRIKWFIIDMAFDVANSIGCRSKTFPCYYLIKQRIDFAFALKDYFRLSPTQHNTYVYSIERKVLIMHIISSI